MHEHHTDPVSASGALDAGDPFVEVIHLTSLVPLAGYACCFRVTPSAFTGREDNNSLHK